MKSYLSLIPISAKVHRRQNRMTILCIMIAVFLVTVIFSLIDTMLQTETNRMIKEHGNWHIAFQNISTSDVQQIKSRFDVAAVSWYEVINDDMQKEYTLAGKKAVLCGVEEAYLSEIWNGIKEGGFPANSSEVMLSSSAKDVLGIHVGDRVTLNTPGGDVDFIVSGFGDNDAKANQLYDSNTVFMNKDAWDIICSLNSSEIPVPLYYVQFKTSIGINKAISEIKQQYQLSDENITENQAVVGMMGASSNPMIQNLYLPAMILFIFILIAGVLMISSSINSNVAKRTQFFGMMRCIGASRQQIIRFVRLEALNWCKTAVPAGVVLGLIISWGICAVLRFGIGGEFADAPIFRLSSIGIASGVVVGLVTVLLAAQAPAKSAAKVSPAAAVSGNISDAQRVRRAANTRFAKIEIALGINHAISAKKNMFLMTGSFALSIILFLGFFAGLDFAHSLLPSLHKWEPDCSIMSQDNSNSIEKDLLDKIGAQSGVKNVYGTMAVLNMPVVTDKDVDEVILVSYGEYMLSCAKDSVVSGDLSKVYGDSNEVLTIYNRENPLKAGDKIQLDGQELNIAGAVSDGLFSDGITVICSEETFTRLTGASNYVMVSVQLTNQATEDDISALRAFAGSEYRFSDTRENNQQSNATFWAFRLFAYSFLAIIAMIAIMNIINSTSMSVSSKIWQYGAMRAVGMDNRQLTTMIAAEVFTYSIAGCAIGCGLGILLHWVLFSRLVTRYFGIPWSLPIMPIGMILIMVIAAAMLAIYAPAKRICKMAVTETINEL